MDAKLKRIIKAHIEERDKEAKNQNMPVQVKRTPSPYHKPLREQMPNYPYYNDQEVTDVHIQLDSPHGGKDPSDIQNDLDKMLVYEPHEDWQNADWAGGNGGGMGDFLAPYENSIQKEFNLSDNSPINLYDPLRGASLADVNEMNFNTSNAIDGFLGNKDVIKLANSDLDDFLKISNDTLIHKSKKDLWKMMKDKEGNIYIKRLFESDVLDED
jgi:hypothetical protein